MSKSVRDDYQEYSISAAGLVPKEWPVVRSKFVFQERKEVSEAGDEELLSASHLSGITKRSEKDVPMFLAETTEGYKIVRSGDAVVNTMWAWMGALGISPHDGLISPSYGVYKQVEGDICDRYYDYLFRSAHFVAEINRRSKGVWSSRLRLYPDDFLNLRLPRPALAEQQKIVSFLDREVSRIDRLVERKLYLVGLISKRWEAIIDESVRSGEVSYKRFGFVARRMSRPISREAAEEYRPLGLYNRGRGIFFKNPSEGNDLGDSEFFRVKAGDLILSGQFAWEGAVSLAEECHDNCVVSHRYPVYRGLVGVDTAYLLAYLRTPPGQFVLEECSRGAAGRNKPLNTNLLEKWKVPVLSTHVQSRIAQIVGYEQRMKSLVARSVESLQEYRRSLITAAVTGQTDAKKWSGSGTSERRIDAIEAEVTP